MGLSEHGEWATATGTEKGPKKVNEALEALGEEDRELLLSWLHDPENWPNNRIARALMAMAKAEGNKKLMVYHSNVNTWRISNGIPQKKD